MRRPWRFFIMPHTRRHPGITKHAYHPIARNPGTHGTVLISKFKGIVPPHPTRGTNGTPGTIRELTGVIPIFIQILPETQTDLFWYLSRYCDWYYRGEVHMEFLFGCPYPCLCAYACTSISRPQVVSLARCKVHPCQIPTTSLPMASFLLLIRQGVGGRMGHSILSPWLSITFSYGTLANRLSKYPSWSIAPPLILNNLRRFCYDPLFAKIC